MSSRWSNDLEPRRPTGPHDRRLCNDGELHRCKAHRGTLDARGDETLPRVFASSISPPGQTIFYRVTCLDLGDLKTLSEPVVGRFRTPPASDADVSFVWSADTVGQGWGINPEIGGMTIYESMRRLAPDFLRPLRRHDLCRQSAQHREEAARRPRLEEPRHARRSRRSPKALAEVPRQPPLQFPRRQSAALQCRGTDGVAVGRP